MWQIRNIIFSDTLQTNKHMIHMTTMAKVGHIISSYKVNSPDGMGTWLMRNAGECLSSQPLAS